MGDPTSALAECTGLTARRRPLVGRQITLPVQPIHNRPCACARWPSGAAALRVQPARRMARHATPWTENEHWNRLSQQLSSSSARRARSRRAPARDQAGAHVGPGRGPRTRPCGPIGDHGDPVLRLDDGAGPPRFGFDAVEQQRPPCAAGVAPRWWDWWPQELLAQTCPCGCGFEHPIIAPLFSNAWTHGKRAPFCALLATRVDDAFESRAAEARAGSCRDRAKSRSPGWCRGHCSNNEPDGASGTSSVSAANHW